MKKTRIIAIFAAVVMLLSSLPLAALATTYARVVTPNDVLHLRSEPNADSSDNIIGKYRNGTKVTVLYNGYRNWVRVRTPDGKVGYMYRNYLSTFTDTGTADAGEVRYVKSGNGGSVNLRQRASTKARLMDRMNDGARVTVLYSGSVWTRVLYNGKDGWVMTKYLSKKK